MFSCLLKRILPFTLTLTVGATLGWLFNFHETRVEYTARLESHPAPFAYGYGRSCRMYRRDLVAETKPLLIRFKPDAILPHDMKAGREFAPVLVSVTFGADGKVQKAEPHLWLDHGMQPVWDAAVRAARQIQFEPEMINSVPVSVTKDVEIHFIAE